MTLKVSSQILGIKFLKLPIPYLFPYFLMLKELSRYEIFQHCFTQSRSMKNNVKEDIKQRALKILEDVLAISHRDKIDFEPLLKCQAKAHELQTQIVSSEDSNFNLEVRALAEGKTPLSDLLMLVEQRDAIDDETWNSLQMSVENSFGKPLAIAASRGKLTVSTERRNDMPSSQKNDTPVKTPEIIEPISLIPEPKKMHEITPEVAPHQLVKDNEDPQETAVQKEQDFEPFTTERQIPPVVAPEMPEELVAPEQPVVSEKRPDSEVAKKEITEKIESPQITYSFTPEDTAQKISGSILCKSLEESPILLRDLIWRLILEDRLPAAFHIARFLQNISPDLQPHLPPWIIRAILLSRYVRYPSGNIARLLKEDFANFGMGCFAEGDKEWNQAVRLLLVASTLRPSLLAPDCQSSPILQNLPMKDGLTELYDYCQKVAKYGSRCLCLGTICAQGGKRSGCVEVRNGPHRTRSQHVVVSSPAGQDSFWTCNESLASMV